MENKLLPGQKDDLLPEVNDWVHCDLLREMCRACLILMVTDPWRIRVIGCVALSFISSFILMILSIRWLSLHHVTELSVSHYIYNMRLNRLGWKLSGDWCMEANWLFNLFFSSGIRSEKINVWTRCFLSVTDAWRVFNISVNCCVCTVMAVAALITPVTSPRKQVKHSHGNKS